MSLDLRKLHSGNWPNGWARKKQVSIGILKTSTGYSCIWWPGTGNGSIFSLFFRTNNLTDPHEKLEKLLRLLLLLDLDDSFSGDIDIRALHTHGYPRSQKAYLTHHVTEDNRQQLFKPYNNFCQRIADIILAFRPDYPYAHSRASSLIETSHHQAFFMQNLPSLTDFKQANDSEPETMNKLLDFMRHLLFSSLDAV